MAAINGASATLGALDALFKRVGASAHNLANVETRGYRKIRADLVESPGQGVHASIREMETPGDPAPEEGVSGMEYPEGSNVNLAEEMVSMISARRSYEANVKSLEIQTDLWGKLLDTVG